MSFGSFGKDYELPVTEQSIYFYYWFTCFSFLSLFTAIKGQ